MNGVALVRRAAGHDVAALVALRAEMFAAMGLPEPVESSWQAHARAWFEERVEDPAYGIFVVDVDATVVACAMGAVRDAAPSPSVPEGRDVLVSNVCTTASHRGRGHGRRAFEAVMQWARASGIARAELMATEDGRGMYERAGFLINRFPVMRAQLDPE